MSYIFTSIFISFHTNLQLSLRSIICIYVYICRIYLSIVWQHFHGFIRKSNSMKNKLFDPKLPYASRLVPINNSLRESITHSKQKSDFEFASNLQCCQFLCASADSDLR